jgi:universal stress protein A
MANIKKATILVAIDFSDDSERALDKALELAPRLDAELELVNVTPLPYASPTEIMTIEPLDMSATEESRAALQRLQQRAAERGVVARTHLMVGSPILGLLDGIHQLDPQLVVVGSHGKTGLERVLMGSVSEALCRRASVPILVVPSPRRMWASRREAFSCRSCGHILAENEDTRRCEQCKESPAHWAAAAMTSEPIDAGVAAVSDSGGEHLDRGSSPSTVFATSPAGVEGYDVNPELRIRY